MEKDKIETLVRKIFLETFQDLEEKDFDFKKKQDQFENWDSLAHIELISKMESNFNIDLNLSEAVGLDSPKDFVNFIKKRLEK